MIKSLKIEHYRSFHSASISDCRRLNIIIGDNGAGKTNLLESLFLVSANSPEVALRLKGWRGFESGMQGSQRDIEDAMWGDLFYNFDKRRNISIAATGDDPHHRRLTISYKPTDLYVSVAKGESGGGPAPVTFRYNVRGKAPVSITPFLEGNQLKFPPIPEPPTEVFFFAANHTYSSTENARRFSILSKSAREETIVEQFTKRFPNIEDLSLELFAGAPMVFAKTKAFKEKIPLNLVSGGMNKLFALLLPFPTAPRCIVLIDELENGIYYKYMEDIIRTMLSFAMNFDAQIFITTHSGEFLDAASRIAEESPGEISIIHAGNGKLRQFDGEKFVDAMKENIEIR